MEKDNRGKENGKAAKKNTECNDPMNELPGR